MKGPAIELVEAASATLCSWLLQWVSPTRLAAVLASVAMTQWHQSHNQAVRLFEEPPRALIGQYQTQVLSAFSSSLSLVKKKKRKQIAAASQKIHCVS